MCFHTKKKKNESSNRLGNVIFLILMFSFLVTCVIPFGWAPCYSWIDQFWLAFFLDLQSSDQDISIPHYSNLSNCSWVYVSLWVLQSLSFLSEAQICQNDHCFLLESNPQLWIGCTIISVGKPTLNICISKSLRFYYSQWVKIEVCL